MAITASVLGVLLVAGAMADIFQTLFHPSSRGALSDWTARIVWKFFRRVARYRRGVLSFAGPFAILSIILSWAMLTWFGFALIYLPNLQSGFAFDQSVASEHRHGLFVALNLSLGALITLSEGTNAVLPLMQSLRAVEAVLGFGLLTASVSWLLSIYPVLELRRAIALDSSYLPAWPNLAEVLSKQGVVGR